MPNRIIREGILTSPRINDLSAGAELFYRRLLSVVDDYGRFHGLPVLLRASCYPLRIDKVSDRDIRGFVGECHKAGVLTAYEVDGKPFVQVNDFNQQVRAKQSKYPQMPANATQMHSRCEQMHTISEDGDEGEDGDGVEDEKPACAIPTGIDTPEFRQAWDDYLAYRKSAKKGKLHPKSQQMLLDRMKLWGVEQSIDAIRTSIANGWTGVFQPKQNDKHSRTTSNRSGQFDGDQIASVGRI